MFRDNYHITKAFEQWRKDKLCPVCRQPSRRFATGDIGFTCGCLSCISLWLRGMGDPCRGLVDHGIQKYESDYIVHVCYVAGEIFVYSPDAGMVAIDSGKYIKRPAYQMVNGKRVLTAGGYTIPPEEINGCSWEEIPDQIKTRHIIKNIQDTSTKGQKASDIVRDCIISGCFPVAPKIKEECDLTLQNKGYDLIVSVEYGSLEIKCDYRGGHRSRGGTGNLYLQTCEINPNKMH